MKLGKAIEAVCDAEVDLARRLRQVGARHAAESDLVHLGQTLARGCKDHVSRLEPFARRYGVTVRPDRADAPDGRLKLLRRKSLTLMADLQQLYLTAQAAELSWTILVQAARAARDRDLLEAAGVCHEEAQLCATWVRTRIKESAPQVYATG